jgi:cysteinyl-tRNA synthetase
MWNSLTRKKNDFVPLDPQGKHVKWYACGPTVYAESHLGHARNYCSTDIIRRIMKDYFGFDTYFVMNVTDVDDKIILRGRQQHLLAKFIQENPTIGDSVVADATTAFEFYVKKNLALLPEATTPATYPEAVKVYQGVRDGKAVSGDAPAGDKEAKIKMHLRAVDAAAEILREAKQKSVAADAFYSRTEDILLPWLDSKYGHTIDSSDHSIFTKLTKKFEDLFFEDMRNLNILDPDKVTRVTEYGPQIVDFVARIVDNGFAYKTSDGSVYFDIAAFEAAGNPYARLEPWNRGDKDLQADGEGALTKTTLDKKSDADFAL